MSQIYGRDLSERIEEIGKRKNYPMRRDLSAIFRSAV